MIYTDPARRLLALHTTHTSYWMGVDETGRLLHLYYGPLRETPPAWPEPYFDPGGRPDRLPQEWPCPGLGDNHAPFFAPEWADGAIAAEMRFAGVKTRCGQVRAAGAARLPHWGGPRRRDAAHHAQGRPRPDADAALRRAARVRCQSPRAAVLENTGEEPVTLRGMPSAVLDFARSAHPALDFVTFDGAWAAERNALPRPPCAPACRRWAAWAASPPMRTTRSSCSARPMAGEDRGECWGAALVYSGNYRMQAESTPAACGFRWVSSRSALPGRSRPAGGSLPPRPRSSTAARVSGR